MRLSWTVLAVVGSAVSSSRPAVALVAVAVALSACAADDVNADAVGGAGGKARASAGAGGVREPDDELGGRGGAAAGMAGHGGQAGGKPTRTREGMPGFVETFVPGECGGGEAECACGTTVGACKGSLCDCERSVPPGPAEPVLTCAAAVEAYPSVSWQAITEDCKDKGSNSTCMAMAPEEAAEGSKRWGDRFCRRYPNPALPIGGVNEGPGKRVYQYCCKPPLPLLPGRPPQLGGNLVQARGQ